MAFLDSRTSRGIKYWSNSHGDTAALINIANEFGIVDLINKHIPKDQKQIRDNCTVGASLLLAAIGRSCHPTSRHLKDCRKMCNGFFYHCYGPVLNTTVFDMFCAENTPVFVFLK